MHVVILGSTGLVGSLLTQTLMKDSEILKLTLIVRRSGKSHSPINEIVLPKLREEDLNELNINADVFISCLGTTIKTAGSKERFYEVDFGLNYAFAKLAKRSEKGKFLLISSLGADAKSAFFYNKVKGELEEAIKDLKLKSTIFFRPSLLIGEREEKRFLEKVGIVSYQLANKVLSSKNLGIFGTPIENLVDKIIIEVKKPHNDDLCKIIDKFH